MKVHQIETLTIYPSKLRLCRKLLLYLVGIAAMIAVAFYIPTIWDILNAYSKLMGVLAYLYGAMVLLSLATFQALSVLVRMFVRRPVLVATVDGIVDNGSLLACGTIAC